MKAKRIIVIVVLAVLCVMGWKNYLSNIGKDTNVLENTIAQADEWVDDGLYQRAINNYKEVLSIEQSEEVWKKLFNAYEKRALEDENILSDYKASLESAYLNYPANMEFINTLIELDTRLGDEDSLFAVLDTAVRNGIDDEDIIKRHRQMKYSYSVNDEAFRDFREVSEGYYSVQGETAWNAINTDGSFVSEYSYEYLSSAGSEGIRVYTNDKDSRLIDANGMVMGIFDFKVQESGVYSNNLIPVSDGSTYAYYDAFAKKVFGEYEYAGSFSGNYAPVKQNGLWHFVDASGNDMGEEYADIIVNDNGKHIFNGVFAAAKEQGKYSIYDENFEMKCELNAEMIDPHNDGSYIAYKQNGKWGYVNLDGEVVIEPQYDEAKSFSNGLAAVCKEGKWGFIDANNTVVIDYQFSGADYFNEAKSCMVKTNISEIAEETWQLIKLIR